MPEAVEAPQIELVENATHPVVFGDLFNYLTQIVQIYQTHLHPGELAGGLASQHAGAAGSADGAAFNPGEGWLNRAYP